VVLALNAAAMGLSRKGDAVKSNGTQVRRSLTGGNQS
jgi:hypothetical protein